MKISYETIKALNCDKQVERLLEMEAPINPYIAAEMIKVSRSLDAVIQRRKELLNTCMYGEINGCAWVPPLRDPKAKNPIDYKPKKRFKGRYERVGVNNKAKLTNEFILKGISFWRTYGWLERNLKNDITEILSMLRSTRQRLNNLFGSDEEFFKACQKVVKQRILKEV